MRASTTWKSASSRVRPEMSGAPDRRALGIQVHAQLGDLRRRDRAGELLDQRPFDQLPRLEHLFGLGHAGARHRRAACRLQPHQAIAAQLIEGLAHQRARDAKDIGQFLLGELGARHQAPLGDRRGDRLDDALGGRACGIIACHAGPPVPRRPAAAHHAQRGAVAGHRRSAGRRGRHAQREQLTCTQKCIHFAAPASGAAPGGVRCGRATAHPPATKDLRMGHLSTHVLDTMHGSPAAGMRCDCCASTAPRHSSWPAFTLDADGRHPGGPLLDAAAMAAGRYRLVFAVAPYFRVRGVTLPEPPFIDEVQLDFGIADAGRPLPRAAAGQPVELFDLSRQLSDAEGPRGKERP